MMWTSAVAIMVFTNSIHICDLRVVVRVACALRLFGACALHAVCMWTDFQTRSAIACFGSFVVTMVCAIGGGPDFQFNSIEDCPDAHVCGSWFSRLGFWIGPRAPC